MGVPLHFGLSEPKISFSMRLILESSASRGLQTSVFCSLNLPAHFRRVLPTCNATLTCQELTLFIDDS